MSRRQILTVLVTVAVATTTLVVRSQTTAKDLSELRRALVDAERELTVARKQFLQSEAGYQRALKAAEPKLPAATIETEAEFLRKANRRIQVVSATYGIKTSAVDVSDTARELMNTGAPIEATMKGLNVGDPAFGSTKSLTLQLAAPRGKLVLSVSEGGVVQFGGSN